MESRRWGICPWIYPADSTAWLFEPISESVLPAVVSFPDCFVRLFPLLLKLYPRDSTYPPLYVPVSVIYFSFWSNQGCSCSTSPIAPSPFMPMGRPGPQFPSPGFAVESYSYPTMHSGSGIPRAVDMQQSYPPSYVRQSHSHHSHSHSHTQPHRMFCFCAVFLLFLKFYKSPRRIEPWK